MHRFSVIALFFLKTTHSSPRGLHTRAYVRLEYVSTYWKLTPKQIWRQINKEVPPNAREVFTENYAENPNETTKQIIPNYSLLSLQ